MDSCYPCRNYAIVRLGQDGVPSSKASPMNCQDGTLAQGCCGIVPEDIDRLIKLRKLDDQGPICYPFRFWKGLLESINISNTENNTSLFLFLSSAFFPLHFSPFLEEDTAVTSHLNPKTRLRDRCAHLLMGQGDRDELSFVCQESKIQVKFIVCTRDIVYYCLS